LKLDAGEKPEFDIWRWVDFWYPAAHVVNFKRQVYERALRQFAPLVEDLFQVDLGTAPPREGTAPPPPQGGRKVA
jgi:putative (di)nucleoside polyphosphate hydrolase